MSRYRNRALKATAALWVFVLLADAGWIATSSGAAALAAMVTVLCVVVAAALFIRARSAEPAPVQVRSHRRP